MVPAETGARLQAATQAKRKTSRRRGYFSTLRVPRCESPGTRMQSRICTSRVAWYGDHQGQSAKGQRTRRSSFGQPLKPAIRLHEASRSPYKTVIALSARQAAAATDGRHGAGYGQYPYAAWQNGNGPAPTSEQRPKPRAPPRARAFAITPWARCGTGGRRRDRPCRAPCSPRTPCRPARRPDDSGRSRQPDWPRSRRWRHRAR